MSISKSSKVQIGCQGWNYDDWISKPGSASVFYPQSTRPADMLGLYARAFDTVEVDSTFYAVPSQSTIEGWIGRTPTAFTFSLKLPQEITHTHALRQGGAHVLKEFCERARLLGAKLGIILVQLPPQFTFTPENAQALYEFLPQLPEDIRFSIEFRSSDWMQSEVMGKLTHHHVALALVEGPWIARELLWKMWAETTADFAYVRWMGARDLVRFDCVQRPQDANLRLWSEAIKRLSKRVNEVHACFSNYYEGHAPTSANKLKRLLEQTIVEAKGLEDQPSLF
jgi:uncharacterized protein YecE (DUF72 family)